ncbi:MAG: TonB-dependent receptor [Colwellia sp.]|nr:TonB-dependent receptor [Colwellia sp.]
MKLGNTSKGRTPLAPLAAAITLALTAPITFAEEEIVKEEEIEKIEVTGTFQQSLINRIPVTAKELPFTLDVIDSEFLDIRNFTRKIEALTTLPNIARTEDRVGSGTTSFLSRGFAAPILVDNRVQNNFRGAGARDDSFVERYEILKGPASIASGPVGAGGIINTVTKSPTATKAVSVKLRGDQFGSAGVDFDVNLGEIDNSGTVLFRISGAYSDFEFDADHVSRTTTAIRPVVIFNIGSETSIKASIAYRENESNPNGGFPIPDGEIPAGIDTDTFLGFVDGDVDSKDVLYNVELNHEFLDNLKLTVRGSKQSTDMDYKHFGGIYSYDGLTTGDYTYLSESSAQNELNATFVDAQLAYQTSFWGQKQDFAIGVAHQEDDWTREFAENYRWEQIPLDQIGTPQYGWDDENYGDFYLFQSTDAKLKSIFAETALRPNKDLTITAGIRYDKLEQDNFRRGSYGYDDNDLTTRLGASYAVNENINLYASFAQAFVPQYRVLKSGAPTEAETSDGIEFGAKGSAFDNRVSFSAAVFSTKRKGVAITDPNDPDYAIIADEVDVEGIELSTITILTDSLSFSFNVGYTDIESSDEVPAPVFPEFTGSMYLNYEAQSGTLEGLTVSGGFRHVGESKNNIFTDHTWDGYNVADLSASYPVTESIKVSLGILNLTDEKYIENTQVAGVNKFRYGAALGAPRTVTMTLRWDM